MSNFKEFANKMREEPNVEGCFECQWCYVNVEGAYYDPVKKTLTWYCENDHKSIIEEFHLNV